MNYMMFHVWVVVGGGEKSDPQMIDANAKRKARIFFNYDFKLDLHVSNGTYIREARGRGKINIFWNIHFIHIIMIHLIWKFIEMYVRTYRHIMQKERSNVTVK